MMAPSIETSCQSSLLLIPSMPIHYINNIFHELEQPPQPQNTEAEAYMAPENDNPTHLVHIATAVALHDVPDFRLPPLPTAFISPHKPYNTDLLHIPATCKGHPKTT
jgi:hypothetical protein